MDNLSHLDSRQQIPGKYRHYKGNQYEVLGTAFHSETQELLVLYKPLYGAQQLWVRPYDMFNDQVSVNGAKVKRFELISSSN